MTAQQTKTILLTGGRAPAALELARIFSRRGARVVAVDSCGPFICEHSRHIVASRRVPSPRFEPEKYANAVLGFIREQKVDLVVPCTEETFYLAQMRDQFLGDCELLCEPIDKLRRLHHKGDFMKWADSLGMSTPKTQVFTKEQNIADKFESVKAQLNSGQPFVLKPAFTRFANEVIISSDGRYEPFDIKAFAGGRDLVYQQFLPGRQVNTFALAHEGKLLFNVAYHGDWTAGKGASIHFAPVDHGGCREWIEAFVAKTNFSGEISFDFIQEARTGKVRPIECNPRVTSGVHLLAEIPEVYDAYVNKTPVELSFDRLKAAQVRLAMVTFGILPNLRKPRKLAKFAWQFARARDVVLDTSDPRPFFYQFYIYQHFMRRALLKRVPLQHVAIEDMVWNDDVLCMQPVSELEARGA